jgi:hypothetical protein
MYDGKPAGRSACRRSGRPSEFSVQARPASWGRQGVLYECDVAPAMCCDEVVYMWKATSSPRRPLFDCDDARCRRSREQLFYLDSNRAPLRK